MSGAELTRAQGKVLAAIENLTAMQGFPPTLREIGDYVGISSSSTIHAHVWHLEQKGRITREPSIPRSIVVIS